jgi:hypothetical protein
MTTIRDHIATKPAIPDPPAGATHVMAWEPYGPSRSQWALGALDGPPDEAALFDGPSDLAPAEVVKGASALLGYPVGLSARIEAEGEVAYYVTPAEGGWS